MYRIAVLTDKEKEGRNYVDQITRFCNQKGLFPQIEQYQNQEQFFTNMQKTEPTSVVVALPGVAGLNAIEHLRSLRPACGIIWCSDLDFSLHAFRLRVEYFMLEPVTEEAFQQGLTVFFEKKKSRPIRATRNTI